MPKMPAQNGSLMRRMMATYRLAGAAGVTRGVARRLKRLPARLLEARH
jgi:hypothetical protein